MFIQRFPWVNRKFLLVIALILMGAGYFFTFLCVYSPGENVPIRICIDTYPRYTQELNNYFNLTEATPFEDAQNKLLEDFKFAGYVILPVTDMPIDGYPVIIWIHGFAFSADYQINYPQQFAQSGFIAIALDQPGHGNSGGLWDLGLSTILEVYSTIEWLVNYSDYKDIINKDQIGISGHSMGGVAVTLSGIFDNQTNPNTGNRIGTGLIRSTCAVFSWDRFDIFAEQIVNRYFGLENVFDNPTVLNLLSHWRFLTNYDPSVLNQESSIRSPSLFINATNINNFCLIIGSLDEFAYVPQVCNLLANSTIDGSGIPLVSASEIYSIISNNNNNTWDFSGIEENKMRRMVLVPGIGHFMEGFDIRVCQNITYWFNDTMGCISVNPDCPWDFQLGGLGELLGWLLLLIGSLMALFPSVAYLSSKRWYSKSIPQISAFPIENSERNAKKLFYIFIGIALILNILSGFLQLNAMTHFWIFDLVIPHFLTLGLSFLIPSILFIFACKKKMIIRLRDVGLGDLDHNVKSILIPILSICLWIGIFDISGWFFQFAFLLPRPFESYVYQDVLLLLGILFMLNFGIELFFRGFYQKHFLEKKYFGKSDWKLYLKSGLISGFPVGLSMSIQFIIQFGPLLILAPILCPLLTAAFIILFTLIGVITSYIFKKTGNILSGTLFLSLIMVLFMSGRLVMCYV